MKAELEHYARQDSVIHRWDARWKVVALSVYIFTVAILNHRVVSLVALGTGLLAIGLSQLPVRIILKRLWVVHFFLIPCFIILPFTTPGTPMGWGPIEWSQNGLNLATLLYLRAVTIVLLSLTLMYSTSMHVLLRAAESLYIPRVCIQVALLTYRYIFTLADELTHMRWALQTRNFLAGMNRHTYYTFAHVIGITLLRSVERTNRIYSAMQCRGYCGSMKTLHRFQTRLPDVVWSSVWIAGAVFLFFWDRHILPLA